MMGDNWIIVASGPSAAGFVPPDNTKVIAVNGAIDWLSRADYWFTLDPSPANLIRMSEPRAGVEYFAALPIDHPPTPAHVTRLERHTETSPEPMPRHTPKWWLWRWGAVCGLSQDPSRINTGNSAWGALQLACHHGAKRIALVGVDANAHKRVEGGRPNNLSHLPLLFESAMGQVEMVNCGHMKTRITTKNIDEGMAWLRS